jgi:ubiquinone/menaquinone biosynthesis C-methylase UbiE
MKRRRSKPAPGSRSSAPRPRPPAATGLRTDWGDVAGWYDKLVGDEGSEYHQQVVHPGVLRLIGLQAGDSEVDIACGQGALCRRLQERGVRVTGVDAARELIAAARKRSETAGSPLPVIDYHVGDARDLSFLPATSFDAAACVLAIQNIHPIQPVFDGVARLLKPMGRFVLVMMHPAFRAPKETSWGWDEQQKIQYRRIDRYLIPRKTPITTHPGKRPDVYTWTFHKPIETFVRSLRNAGMLIDALEEWPSHKTSTSGPRAHAENEARKEIPMFLAIRAMKIAPTDPPPV